jgi:hypothetical protein
LFENTSGFITPNADFSEYRFPVWYDGSATFPFVVRITGTGTDTGSYLDIGDFQLVRGWDSQPFAQASSNINKWDLTGTTLTNRFATTNGKTYFDINWNSHGMADGNAIRISGSTPTDGVTFDGFYNVKVIDPNTLRAFTIYTASARHSSVGGTATGYPQIIPIGPKSATAIAVPVNGSWPAGYIVYNSNPSSGAPTGWVRNSSGTWNAIPGITNGTVATLPACGASLKGAMAYVTDASSPSFLGALSGGGSVVAPAFCNGTNWVAH